MQKRLDCDSVFKWHTDVAEANRVLDLPHRSLGESLVSTASTSPIWPYEICVLLTPKDRLGLYERGDRNPPY